MIQRSHSFANGAVRAYVTRMVRSLGGWVLGLCAFSALLQAQAQISFTEYSIRSEGILPTGITSGPDGALWFTEEYNTANLVGIIGRMTTTGTVTEYPISAHTSAGRTSFVGKITSGPDGALWAPIYENGASYIERITTAGAINEFPLPAGTVASTTITRGPDGALWFPLSVASVGMIGRMTTAGVLTTFPIPPGLGGAAGITTGPGGLWSLFNGLTLSAAIGQITLAGAITTFPLSSVLDLPASITAGPDGALWFTYPKSSASQIGRITPAGVLTLYDTPGVTPTDQITTGPDGALWFTVENFAGMDTTLGRITTAGVFTTYVVPTSVIGDAIMGLTNGPDGALWVITYSGSIGRVAVTSAPNPTVSNISPPLGTVGFFYSAQLSAMGGAPPYNSWSVSDGSLPPGLVLDSSSGLIFGPAADAGAFNFSVTVQDSAKHTSAAQDVSITISPSVPGLTFIGGMPHIAAEENWTTTFTLVNKGSAPATARLSLFGDLRQGTLPLPLVFPQQPPANPLIAAAFDRTIAANASLIVQTAGPHTPPVQVGSAQLQATGPVDGFAIFHHNLTQQETVVPIDSAKSNFEQLVFDNTGGNVLGIALANPSSQAAYVGVNILDETGAGIEDDRYILPANGHLSFVLPAQYPKTANVRGIIKFSSTSTDGANTAVPITVLGMRFTPPNNALTTIPPLGVNGTGGSIAHIATGNGWQTTFVLVNSNYSSGTDIPQPVPTQFQLNFFADDGSPLAVPVGFPQTANGATMVTSSVQQTLAPASILLIESAAPLSDAAPTVGSAQLTANGAVNGFVIFRYNPNGQEAVVPLDSRNATGYILAFDNTAGTATGVAVNNVSSIAANVPVTMRDDSGNLLATDTLTLAPNGHAAFTLVTDKYPATANIRGTIEFDTPPGGQIGALAFRMPVTHTFTTLPALAK
jgi:virginiamycin B lyase